MWSIQHLLAVFSFVLALILVSRVLRERRPPGSTLAWVFAMIVVPYVGVPLYLMIGGRKTGRLASTKRGLYSSVEFSMTPQDAPTLERILLAAGMPPKTEANSVSLLSSPTLAYTTLISQIRSARESIEIATFILADDEVGTSIIEALRLKSQAGIRIRLLLDGFGSFFSPRRKLRNLVQAGAQVRFFMPILKFPFPGISNLRNHRKVALIDGKSAIIGGMNLSCDYLAPKAGPRQWTDLCVLIEGEAAVELQQIFLSDWAYAGGESFSASVSSDRNSTGTDTVQVVATGPDVPADPLYDALLLGIFAAKKRIWVATPYFVPDESLARALELACRRGVDVRVLLPAKSNHMLADLSRGSYLKQIRQAGGSILFYHAGMMHAKMVLIDNDFAFVGSANFDVRSLLLNYEAGVLMSSPRTVEMIQNWFESLLPATRPAPLKENFATDLIEGVGRVLGPML